jgi:hypothetical protein
VACNLFVLLAIKNYLSAFKSRVGMGRINLTWYKYFYFYLAAVVIDSERNDKNIYGLFALFIGNIKILAYTDNQAPTTKNNDDAYR